MNLLSLYLRREPARDPIVQARGLNLHQDVVAYKDADGKVPVGRWPWHYRRPDRRNKWVTLNCYRWKAIWLPDLDASTGEQICQVT